MLLRKTLRSIWGSKRSYTACIFLLALGVASYVGFTQASYTLIGALFQTYDDQDFGHAFAQVEGIPPSGVDALERIPGVDEVSARTTVTARMDHPEKTLSVSLMSLNDDEDSWLNRPILADGQLPDRGEVTLNEEFMEAHDLAVGDAITLTANSRQLRLVISGVAGGPDYVSHNSLVLGYGYVREEAAETLADSGGLADDITFLLEDGVAFRDVEADLTEALTRYGLKSLYGRDDHPGHQDAYLSILSLQSTAGMIAFIFFGAAILVLCIVLRRVVEQERTQIGTLKAFGFSSGKILLLYLGYGVVISLLGALLGCLGGMGVAAWSVNLFLTMFRMPVVQLTPDGGLLLSAFAVSLIAGLAGAALGARSALKLGPAEAMRPPAPPMMKARKRSGNRKPFLPPSLSMALRGISRGRFRSGFVAGGMAFSFAVLTFMSSYASIMDELLMAQFNHIQLFDMKVSMAEPKSYESALESARGLRGVESAEGALEVPVTIHRGHLQEEARITGLTVDSQLWRLYDSVEKRYREVPESGVTLSAALADRLGAAEGDSLRFTTGYTGDDQLTVQVASILGENMGYNAYMDLDSLCGLLGSGRSANQLLLKTDDPAAVKEVLTDAAGGAALTDQQELKEAYQNNLNQTLGVNVGLFAIIGLGVAIALIGATASISLSERAREYATLLVLGKTPGEIGGILILEYLLLTLAAIAPGIPMAYGFRALLSAAMSDQPLAISPIIDPIHFLVGGGLCLLVAAVANLNSIRQIARLSMTDVLKDRE